MMRTLGLRALAHLPTGIAVPEYPVAGLSVGILHFGLGAFHRAHQAMFTEDALQEAGGDWGIAGVAFHNPAIPNALSAQDHLYTVETLSEAPTYRISAVVRSSLLATMQAAQLRMKFLDPNIHIVTLTITEKGYCLDQAGLLDFSNRGIAQDLHDSTAPVTAIGWLALGLAARFRASGAPVTVMSCDNLLANGVKLERAVTAFLAQKDPDVVPWVRNAVRFPQSVVDCIVPASSESSLKRVSDRISYRDDAAVQREPYSQWIIEDTFAGPRPAWERVGARIVTDVDGYARLKLHVLNASHSALAYLGLARGHLLVREAAADPVLTRFLDHMVEQEVRPALVPLDVGPYWSEVRQRFLNRHIDHQLAQIAEDGQQKLSQRVFPLMIANLRTGAPVVRFAKIIRAWLDYRRLDPRAALDDALLFPPAIASHPVARAAILEQLA